MKTFRVICFLLAAISAGFAAYLSFQVDMDYRESESLHETHGQGVGISIDSGKDGGAAGFAVLSGLALVAASITYLGNKQGS